METIKLTREAKILLRRIYRQYKLNRRSGLSKSDSSRLGSSKDIHQKTAPNWIFEDVDAVCRELDKAGLLSCFLADGIAYSVVLTDLGIVQMEQRFSGPLKTVINLLQTLIGKV